MFGALTPAPAFSLERKYAEEVLKIYVRQDFIVFLNNNNFKVVVGLTFIFKQTQDDLFFFSILIYVCGNIKTETVRGKNKSHNDFHIPCCFLMQLISDSILYLKVLGL